ncbi:MAG: 50S ribosomal protein L4 [Promethearchaeota archaeon]
MEQKIAVYGLDGKKKDSIDLPLIFNYKPRKDLIKRSVISIQLNEKQPQGRNIMAGKRNTARTWGSGYGVSRTPRLKGSGYPTARHGAFAPGTTGGRLAHPPKTQKNLIRKLNKQERRLAIISAISATGAPKYVKERGHKVDKIPSLPLVIDDKFQAIKKTKDVKDVFEKLGLIDDILRVKNGKKIRAGKGKRRGRKYKNKKSILIVIKEDFGIYKAARNLPGVDIININKLNCNLLAPGTRMGRLTLWTQSAFNNLNKLGEKYGKIL